jgi:hypothetical protein
MDKGPAAVGFGVAGLEAEGGVQVGEGEVFPAEVIVIMARSRYVAARGGQARPFCVVGERQVVLPFCS